MNKQNKASFFIEITGYILFALAGIACLLCLFFGFRQGVYKEELQTQGIWLMIGSFALAVLFLSVWIARRREIARFLLDEYGEECCKPIRKPAIVIKRQNDVEESPSKGEKTN